MSRERYINNSGYGFKRAGAGVWTEAERARESLRRQAAQTEAATAALAQTEQKIAEIQGDATLSLQGKLRALTLLTASGTSTEEFSVLTEARKQAETEYRGG